MLISTFLRCQQPATARDIPVFLPDTSPATPYRLLTVQLRAGVEVCVLCGPKPLLNELLDEVDGRRRRTRRKKKEKQGKDIKKIRRRNKEQERTRQINTRSS